MFKHNLSFSFFTRLWAWHSGNLVRPLTSLNSWQPGGWVFISDLMVILANKFALLTFCLYGWLDQRLSMKCNLFCSEAILRPEHLEVFQIDKKPRSQSPWGQSWENTKLGPSAKRPSRWLNIKKTILEILQPLFTIVWQRFWLSYKANSIDIIELLDLVFGKCTFPSLHLCSQPMIFLSSPSWDGLVIRTTTFFQMKTLLKFLKRWEVTSLKLSVLTMSSLARLFSLQLLHPGSFGWSLSEKREDPNCYFGFKK